jgi:hypothetical protein
MLQWTSWPYEIANLQIPLDEIILKIKHKDFKLLGFDDQHDIYISKRQYLPVSFDSQWELDKNKAY